MIVISLIITIGSIIYILPIININNTGASGVYIYKSKCPENSSGVKTSYKVTGYNDCYCITGSTLNNDTNKCEPCPSGSSTIETSVLARKGCYCSIGNMWDSTQNICIPYPEGSTTANTGITIPGYNGVYCLSDRLWNSTSKKCEKCPNGSSTTTTNTPVPNHSGCFCTTGKLWDSTKDECITGICDGGSIQNGICTCKSGYYLYNNTKCTQCIDGVHTGNICTCPENMNYSSIKDGCVKI